MLQLLFGVVCSVFKYCFKVTQLHLLHSLDIYHMHVGLQEFVEAYTFYSYIKEKTLPSIEDVSKKLEFRIEVTLVHHFIGPPCVSLHTYSD